MVKPSINTDLLRTSVKNHKLVCEVCGSDQLFTFYEVSEVPVQTSVLCSSFEDALQAPVADIKLVCCKECSYIRNLNYDYSNFDHSDTQISLEHSPSFRQFTLLLASDLIQKWGIRNKTILDIGCGDGDFLKTMSALGNNQGIGIDPGVSERVEGKVRFIKDYFSEKYAELKADFISCRHMLQDIESPIEMLRHINITVRNNPDALVYIEVPNAQYSLEEKLVWNIIYEHNSWFIPGSLSKMIDMAGFQTLQVLNLWGEEYFGVVCKLKEDPNYSSFPSDHSKMDFLEEVSGYFNQVVKEWKEKVSELKTSNKKIVAWGAGARAITFFSTYDLTNVVAFLVDINPKRQGKFLPRSGQKVVSPEALREFNPDVILITNPTYKEEIVSQVREMGLSPEIISL